MPSSRQGCQRVSVVGPGGRLNLPLGLGFPYKALFRTTTVRLGGPHKPATVRLKGTTDAYAHSAARHSGRSGRFTVGEGGGRLGRPRSGFAQCAAEVGVCAQFPGADDVAGGADACGVRPLAGGAGPHDPRCRTRGRRAGGTTIRWRRRADGDADRTGSPHSGRPDRGCRNDRGGFPRPRRFRTSDARIGQFRFGAACALPGCRHP